MHHTIHPAARPLLSALLAVCVSGILLPAPAAAQSGAVSSVRPQACPQGLSVVVTVNDPGASAPRVEVSLPGVAFEATLVGAERNLSANGGQAMDFVYWNERALASGAQGVVVAHGPRGDGSTAFIVDGHCPPLGSVRGMAFEDLNRDGKMDPGEPAINTAGWKLTTGGSWFICGYVGGDATYGATVKPGTFTIIPVAHPGWRATTPVRQALVRSLGYAALNNHIGFARDPASRGDNCGQYAPVGVAPVGVAPPLPPAPAPVPPSVSGNAIPGTLGSYGLFSSLLRAAEAAGMLGELNAAANVTLFAPTDQAFARLDPGQMQAVWNDPRQLERLVRNHLAPARVAAPAAGASGTYKTQGGQGVQIANVDGVLRVSAGRIHASASQPVAADHGSVIFPIDRVLWAP
jgi:hypothetical protein